MANGMTVAYTVATVVPIVALVAVAQLDRQKGRDLVLVAAALVWGLVATWLVAPLNARWDGAFGRESLITLGAPILEELIKASVLVVLVRSRRCSWFVDGALYGLAAGTGFAIRENWLYIASAADDAGLGVAIARVSSTNLMHAGCTAIIGVALAASRRRSIPVHIAIGLGAWIVAVVLHAGFNRATTSAGSALVVTLIGLVTFAVAAGVAAIGMPVSTRWARAEMTARGLAAGERAVLGQRAEVDDLLDGFEARFGAQASAAAEEFVAVQRRIGVVAQDARASGENSSAAVELARLEAQADEIRRRIGVFPMTWLRSHLPTDGATGLWASLDTAEAPPVGEPRAAPSGLWARLDDASSTEPGNQPG
jgi:RsiW-degrading membrane proteinase PrsW (M82 family)